MDNEIKAEIEKLGLQEFPKKSSAKVEKPITVPEQIERITSREDFGVEQERKKVEEKISQEGESSGEIGGIVAQGQASQEYKEREKAIDKILSEGLDELYLKMSAQKQNEFKETGEETTRAINNMLSETKVKVQKIISLIRNWLSLIPGVNKFFLEQETKIRTDKILKLKD